MVNAFGKKIVMIPRIYDEQSIGVLGDYVNERTLVLRHDR